MVSVIGDSASREEQAKKTIQLLKKTNNLLKEDPPNLRSARSEFQVGQVCFSRSSVIFRTSFSLHDCCSGQATVNASPMNVEVHQQIC